MQNEQTNDNKSGFIEDLTVDDAKTDNIKGGVTPISTPTYLSFGVEREMKESGEKGGTEDV